MDENDEEEETGSVRRDFTFGASNYIVSVLHTQQQKISRLFLFVVEERAEKYFPSPLRQNVIGKKKKISRTKRENWKNTTTKPADDWKCLWIGVEGKEGKVDIWMSLLAPTCQLFVLLLRCAGPVSVCVCETDVHYNHYEFITWWRGPMSFLHPALKSGPFPVVQTRLGRLLPSSLCRRSIHTIYNTAIRFRAEKCRIHLNYAPRLDRDEMVVLLLHAHLISFFFFRFFLLSPLNSFLVRDVRMQSTI